MRKKTKKVARVSEIKFRKPTAKGKITFRNKKKFQNADIVSRKAKHKKRLEVNND